ncbi:hypothetical protein P280DRAFT_170701 [Massarina eburnea CBS 473.64]|uniref:C2H2-type domain-containing protein n=1 Tax=Massarina eburnea CBS 473.64 TaxID=1395130 RepID=A0A6A6SC34_9PLEO|nr:hypothetical protein P280DRAFT_170701 [Massarina eburnea CBS 473.64]
MTKKRKRYPDLQQKLERPWCYYCERDFDDLKILISHQKAKHFKCERCGRRLNTAGGLSVHMNQVHKENLTHVENATSGRQNLDIEIFGMEGVPAEIIDQHNQAVTEKHFAEQAERQRLSGNPARGAGFVGEDGVKSKRARVHETVEEVESRAEKWRTDRRNGVARPVKEVVVADPTPPAQPTHFAPPGAAPFASNAQLPPAGIPGQPPFAPGQFGAPPPGISALPTRPPGFPPQLSDSLDDLIASSVAAAEQQAPEKEKKAKKGKDVKLVFFDESVSPEEKMAKLSRFGDFMQT